MRRQPASLTSVSRHVLLLVALLRSSFRGPPLLAEQTAMLVAP